MTKLEQIEKSVAELSPAEMRRFARWFEEHKETEWDRQIEADAKAGKLDKFISEARAEIKTGKLTPL
jgi:DNA repair photolyase